MLAVADRSASLIITGTGDVLEPEYGIVAIGSGGAVRAGRGARAARAHDAFRRARSSSKRSTIAGDLCIYTNQNHVIEVLRPSREPSASVTRTTLRRRDRRRRARRPGARAGARARRALRRARRSRARRGAREPDADDDWDARVYAISPGSAAFLRAHRRVAGAAVRAHRRAIESMHVDGDAGAHARVLGLRPGRARARVDRRGARAARGAACRCVHAAGVDDASRRVAFASLGLDRRRAATLRFADGARVCRAADRRRRRRCGRWVREAAGIAAVAASPTARPAVVANFACERAHHGRAHAVVSRRRQRARVAAAARAPHLDRLVGARRAGGGAAGARRPTRWPRAWPTAGSHALGALDAASRRRRLSARVPAAAARRRPSARAGRRRRARRASAGRAGRQPRFRRCARRSRPSWPSAARSTDAGRAAAARTLCAPPRRARAGDADGHRRAGAAVRRRARPGSGRCATPACPPSTGCRLLKRACWRNLRCARLSNCDRSSENS